MNNGILVIDDSESSRKNLKAILAGLGFNNVMTSGDASEAMSIIQKDATTADLILMDLDLSGGIEFCASVKSLSDWQDVPILVMQGTGSKASLSEALFAGANDYVGKPFDRTELRVRINNYLLLRSEVSRRCATERDRRLKPAPRNLIGSPEMPGLMLGKHGFLAALKGLSQRALPKLGYFALRLNPNVAAAVGISEFETEALIGYLGEQIATFPLPGADLVAHWQDGTFICASLTQDQPELARHAALLNRALTDSLNLFPTMEEVSDKIASATAAPGSFETVADGIGNVMRALELDGLQTGQMAAYQLQAANIPVPPRH
ncbi:response regulator [Puniceibacterium sediminis]|uniref:Response regulator receiver domain-containing protein n=1 Tax=Puniceibacterium sediminis TaxID=1608407 RepID=A0A238XNK8_9RHOB|nr:response regulator [Puniceibacterium sediminis]SNR59589.1 Response regulator receiver domain-containing protein [Puniceibacterium sediminis]